jgi:hypothetical protein
MSRLPRAANLGTITHALLCRGTEHFDEVSRDELAAAQPFFDEITAGRDIFGEYQKSIDNIKSNLSKALVMAHTLREVCPPHPSMRTIFKEISVETPLTIPHSTTTIPLAGTLDALCHFSDDDSWWVVDYKTTSRNILDTLVGYEYGPQKRFYRLLATALLRFYLNDPTHPGPAGFILRIIRSPSIVMSNEDRDYTEYSHVLKSGPRKGQTELRRDYTGEPKFDNYLKRCRSWYASQIDLGACNSAVQSFSLRFAEPILPLDFWCSLLTVHHLMYDAILASRSHSAPMCGDSCPTDPTARHCCSASGPCDYYALCSRSQQSWQNTIDQRYLIDDSSEPIDPTQQFTTRRPDHVRINHPSITDSTHPGLDHDSPRPICQMRFCTDSTLLLDPGRDYGLPSHGPLEAPVLPAWSEVPGQDSVRVGDSPEPDPR